MTYQNIIGDSIEYIQRKTKEDRPITVRVPLSKTAIALIDKYREEGRESLFPFPRNSIITARSRKRSGLPDWIAL